MLDIMTLSPPVGALRQQPMAVAEIDAHPDRDRIWATIMAVRADADDLVAAAEWRADNAEEDGRDDERFRIVRRLEAALREVAHLSEADRTTIMEALG